MLLCNVLANSIHLPLSVKLIPLSVPNPFLVGHAPTPTSLVNAATKVTQVWFAKELV